MSKELHELLDDFTTTLAAYDGLDRNASDRTVATAGHRVVEVARELVTSLGLCAYAVEPNTDDRLEQVVFSVHGIEVSIRGRRHDRRRRDVLVHVDDQRDDDDRSRHPLVVGVGEGNENEYA
ncbi:hypothetical protein AB0F93_00415 [Micromonospora tulbaghiae]|uniref:hypothetical protein n=1 Tax=Micromonospora tulbaghiae TaxID=479978 RepID=UPI003325F08F